MKKKDYFKLAIINHKYVTKKWIVSAFALTAESGSVDKLGVYDIYSNQTGHFFKDEKGQLVKIEDAPKDEPIFRFLDPIEVSKDWVANAPEKPTVTTYGNVIFNVCTIVNAFNTKLDFVFGQVDIGSVEDKIAKKLTEDKDLVEGSDQISISEYIKFVDSLQFIGNLSSLCTVSATQKSIQTAPGFEEFKKTLIQKYGDKLSDPTEYVKFETELKAFDDAYLKGDPSTKAFLTGRIKDVARKKMFLTLGTEQSFNAVQSSTPVINSLHEGWPVKDPKQFTAMMNGIRFGSFSRGSETVRGGVAAKILLRSGSNFKVIDNDCGTKLGITRLYQKHDIDNLVGRFIIVDKNIILIKTIEQAQSYIGKEIIVRSPMYCRSPGESICKICAGTRLSSFPNGLTIPLTDMSTIILYTSMKAMHGKVLSTAEIDINEALS